MTDPICLNKKYSTTRLVVQRKPRIVNKKDDKLKTILFLPSNKNTKKEGGLRTKGYFKKSYNRKPLISIITVVFNGRKHLQNTIESVLNQDYDNVEYVIIDGGSTDGTINIIKKYEYKIDYWVSEKDKGIYDAMNKGIDLVQGKWINFMNAGDKILYLNDNDFLFMKSTYTNFFYDCNTNKILHKPLKKIYLTRNTPCHQSIIYKRSELIKYDINIPIMSDFNQMLKITNMKSYKSSQGNSIMFYNKSGVSNMSEHSKLKTYKYLKLRSKFIYKELGLIYGIISVFHLLRILIKKQNFKN